MVKSGKFKVNQPSIFGRIGTGIGKGLAEQLPKEIQHGRLSAGLKDFAENSGNLSPLEAYAKAGSIYGITPQLVQALPEIVKYQNERQAAINAGNQGSQEEYPTNNVSQPNFSNQTNQSKSNPPSRRENLLKGVQDFANRNQSLTSAEPTQTALGEIRPPTQQEIFNKRSQILKQNPWMSVPQAQAQAEDYFDRLNNQKKAKIEQGLRQENIESNLQQKLDDELNRLSIAKNLSPERRIYLRNKAEEDIANGTRSITQAVRHWAELGNQEVKDQDEFNKMAESPLIMQKNNVVNRNLENGAKTAKKLEKSPEYSKDIQAKFGTSKEYADSIAYNLSNNKDLFSYVNKKTPYVGRGLALIPDYNELKTRSIKSANETYQHFKPDDSFNSFIVKMKEKDPLFDDLSYKDRMLQLYEEGKLSLTPEQKNELEYAETSWFPNLYDWWMKLSR